MTKKVSILTFVLSLSLIAGAIGVTAYAAESGYIWGDSYGSVTTSFSSNYGCYSGAINHKPSGIVAVNGYKYKNGKYDYLGNVNLTESNRSGGFKKWVGSSVKKIKTTMSLDGVEKLSSVRQR